MASTLLDLADELSGLRLRWLAFVLLCAGVLSGLFTLLFVIWEPEYAFRWLVIATIVSVYPVVVLWFTLSDNHRIGEQRIQTAFGLGTNLTLVRGLLIALLSGFLLLPRPGGLLAWVPGVLYGLAVLADLFDGYFARIEDSVTKMGQNLDMKFDSMGILTAVLLAIHYGQIPPWYIVIAIARYLYLFGLYLWKLSGGKVFELPHNPGRRAFAGLQMGFLVVILLPLFSPPGTFYSAGLIAVPFLIGFIRDWMVAAGIIQNKDKLLDTYGLAVKKLLPVMVRIAIPIVYLLFFLADSIRIYRNPEGLNMIIWFELAVIFFVSAGIAGRLMGILGLCLLGFHQMSGPLTDIQLLLLAGYVAVIYLGTGIFSLWTPERRLLKHRLGETGA